MAPQRHNGSTEAPSAYALRYALIDGALYKKAYLISYLRCLRPPDAESTLREVHEGIEYLLVRTLFFALCGQHLGGRALAHKIARLGFYWPNMLNEARNFVRKCERCQKHAPIVRQPPEMLTSINSPISFAMWGMDILGPFPIASREKKILSSSHRLLH